MLLPLLFLVFSKIIFEEQALPFQEGKKIQMMLENEKECVGYAYALHHLEKIPPSSKTSKFKEQNKLTLNALPVAQKALKIPLNEMVLLANVYIYPEFRGKGYGTLLVEHVSKRIFQSMKPSVIVLIPHPFEPSCHQKEKKTAEEEQKKASLIKFYKKIGFKESGTTPFFMYLAV